MNFEFTDLIISQAKMLAVMFCAGVLVQIIWQGKRRVQQCIAEGAKQKQRIKCHPAGRQVLHALAEVLFWVAAGAILSAFLYYCSYGRLSFLAFVGFWVGFCVWNKVLSIRHDKENEPH